MTATPRKIAILGPGAVGSALGGFFAAAGHRVTLIGRPNDGHDWPAPGSHLDAIRSGGLLVDGIKGRYATRPEISADIPDGVDAPDLILLTVKSFDTAQAARRIAEANADCPVLHLQNGIGNFELLREVLPEERILSGMIIIGFTIPEPGRATVTVYGGDIKVGRMSGGMDATLEDVVALFDALPFTTHAVGDIGSHLWGKLLYNCALNPLGAIFNVPYGRLLDQTAQDMIREILEEAFRTAAAYEIPLFWPDSETYRAFLTGTQIPATADHFPSMGADLRAGKRTEIDFLNGAVARLARQRDLPAPVNTTITRQIRFLENASGAGRAGGFSS